MSKPLIAIDIDDVLVPRVYPVIEFLNRRFNMSFNIANMTGESFFGFVSDCFADKARPEELSGIIERYLSSDDYRKQQPTAGAVEVLGWLAGTYRLWVLSTRPKSQHPMTRGWLNEHFNSTFDKVVLINEGHFGFNDTRGFSKASFCAEHGLGLLLDDRLTTCLEMVDGALAAVLFGDYPWNQAKKLPPGMTRARDWWIVKEYFNGVG